MQADGCHPRRRTDAWSFQPARAGLLATADHEQRKPSGPWSSSSRRQRVLVDWLPLGPSATSRVPATIHVLDPSILDGKRPNGHAVC